MNSDDTTRTSPTLLRRTADWRDHAAWQELVARYDPLIRSWCREYRLDDDIAAAVWCHFSKREARCQRCVWRTRIS